MAKAKRIVVPFDLDSSVRPVAQVTVGRATDLDLSQDGTLVIAAGTLVFTKGDESLAAPGDLAGHEAEHVAWSPDGARIATVHVEWKGNAQTAHVAVHDWPSGKEVARAEMPKFGSVSHALPGASAPTCAWSRDGARVYVRSASMDTHVSSIGVLDVATGALRVHKLAGTSSYVFSIAADERRIFALCSESGDDAGLVWLDAKKLGPIGRAPEVSGECVVPTASGVWVVGDDCWVWLVDVDALDAGKARKAASCDVKTGVRARWERRQELKSRAKAKWDVDHLAWCEQRDEDRASEAKRRAAGGAALMMHREPDRIAQACAFASGLVVRDGVRVAYWKREGSELVVTPLVEDPQRATTSKARHRLLAASGGRLALGWQKASNKQDMTCTVFEVDSSLRY